MIELSQYAESLHQPIPSLEELVVGIQTAFQPFIDALKRVAQAIGEALQPFFCALHKLTHPNHSCQERLFLAVIRKKEQKKRHVVRARSRRTYFCYKQSMRSLLATSRLVDHS